MNKKIAAGICISAVLLVALGAAVLMTDWDDYTTSDTPQEIPFSGDVDESGELDHNSLNYALFEEYGPLLLVLALLMFGAIIGGVCISREEDDHDDSD